MNFSKLIYLGILISLLFAACAKPIADFTYTGNTNHAPIKIDFQNKSSEAEAYDWNFGDGATSSDPSPSHEYKESGNYTVTLIAKKGKKTKTIEKQIQVEAPEHCLVEIETDYGNMIAILYDATPGHRDNFIKLVEEEFYDGIIFHRIINGFMIQGGDPNSKNAKPNAQLGSGGPGYQIPAEFVDSLIHVKGALAAARTNNPKKESSGSQFYIVQGKPLSDGELNMMEARQDARYTKEQREAYRTLGGTPQLDREYTVFGRVIKGLEVIDKIAAVRTGNRDRPVKDVKMKIRAIR